MHFMTLNPRNMFCFNDYNVVNMFLNYALLALNKKQYALIYI